MVTSRLFIVVARFGGNTTLSLELSFLFAEFIDGKSNILPDQGPSNSGGVALAPGVNVS